MPTMGSLFAGIGGFDLGFERAGFQTVWQVEINDYCRKVLAKHFPHAERFADVRECGAHNLKSVDVICGGFPCQDVSSANVMGAGLDGTRSGLWVELRRIVGELQPKFVVVENVAALLSDGMGRVLGDLAEIGYDAEWDCIPAAAVGAPHLRDRVFILAYPAGQRRPKRGEHLWFMSADDRCNTRTWNYRRVVKPGIPRVADGIPDRVERLRGIGNAVVPQIAEFIAERLIEVVA